ncbi:MAG TPA: DM13 domain-containing protein [Ardenticatenaceae bacterium]|nr:DM13 domain-containing protein [Ardenticatenaceae bacterium]
MFRRLGSIDIRLRLLLLVLLAAVGLPVAWYLGSPLFIDRSVDEAFPDEGASPAAGAAPEASKSEQDGPVAQQDDSALSTMGDEVDRPTGPAALTSGEFVGTDTVHEGEGTAAVYELDEGQRVLRFEGFSVTNGPDLYVYLSGHAAPRSSAQLHEGAALEVARLKGNVGDQNYDLPTDLDLSQFKSVVIYCKRFSVVFSTATLESNS